MKLLGNTETMKNKVGQKCANPNHVELEAKEEERREEQEIHSVRALLHLQELFV
jgi:hypothetical protein